MENRFEHTPPEEQQGWGRYATPPPVPGQENSFHADMPPEMRLCSRVRVLLPHLIENDGEVRPEMTSQIYGHLSVCPACAHEFDEMNRVVAVLETMPPAEMPMDFSSVIMRRLQSPNGPVPHGVPPLPSRAASSPILGEAARTAAREDSLRTQFPSSGSKTASVSRTLQKLATQTRQETWTYTGTSALQRLTVAGVLTAILAFFLSTSLGRQSVGVNLETARLWLTQISDTLERVPLLGRMVAFIFAALTQVGSLLDSTYRDLGGMAVRGLTLDIALCVVAYYFLVTRRQRGQMRGI
jgi:hypothetical protein